MITTLVNPFVLNTCQDIADKLSSKEFNEIVVIIPGGLGIGQCLANVMGLPIGAWIPETNAFITSQVIPTKILFVDLNDEYKISEIHAFFSLAYPAMDWSYVRARPAGLTTFQVEISHQEDPLVFEEDYDMDSIWS